MGLRQKNNCDWDKNAGEIRLLFCPSVCPKASREINSFGTVFCLKLGQSLKKDWDKKCSLTELVFCPSICPKQSLFQEQDWDKKITAVGTKSACDFAESMGQNGREK